MKDRTAAWGVVERKNVTKSYRGYDLMESPDHKRLKKTRHIEE